VSGLLVIGREQHLEARGGVIGPYQAFSAEMGG
jgi:hypothetical protein